MRGGGVVANYYAQNLNSTKPVSYTHLDVYKRQALESSWPVLEIILRGRANDDFSRSILEKARAQGVDVFFMNPRDFDSRYDKASQGVAARVGQVDYRHPDLSLIHI